MVELQLLTGFLALTLLVSAAFTYYCGTRRGTRGAAPLTVMFIGITIWILADLIQLLTPTDPAPVVGVQLRLIGPDVTVLGLLLFGIAYTGRSHLLSRKVLALLAIKPLFTAALVIGPYTHLFVDVGPETAVAGYNFVYTPFFIGYTLYNWILTIAGLVLLGHMMFRATYGYQRQISALVLAILIPFLLNVGFHVGPIPFDVTSTSFLATAGVFVFATFRLRLMDAIPVARQTVVEEMEDMVIVLDESGEVVSVNDAVRQRFDRNGDLTGQPAEVLFDAETVDKLHSDSPADEVTVSIDGERRYLDIKSSPLQDYRGNLIAEVLVCRDITENKRKERKLRHREEDLKLLKDLQSRFLRHNLRNELNVLRANAQLMLDGDEPDDQERYEYIVEKTDEIIEWSDKARTIEELIELEETTACDVDGELELLVDEVATEHEDVDFRLHLAADHDVEAVPELSHALENAIDNAARYNTASDPHVVISTESDGETVDIFISDNGPGIDPVVIESIQNGTGDPMEHGSGLGLWLVQWVVEKSNGTLDIDSSDDGTTVHLTFNVARSGQTVEQTA